MLSPSGAISLALDPGSSVENIEPKSCQTAKQTTCLDVHRVPHVAKIILFFLAYLVSLLSLRFNGYFFQVNLG